MNLISTIHKHFQQVKLEAVTGAIDVDLEDEGENSLSQSGKVNSASAILQSLE